MDTRELIQTHEPSDKEPSTAIKLENSSTLNNRLLHGILSQQQSHHSSHVHQNQHCLITLQNAFSRQLANQPCYTTANTSNVNPPGKLLTLLCLL